MSSNKVEGLCAPTVTAVQRKVKGYIFRAYRDPTSEGHYYAYIGTGRVHSKEDAHVFSAAEAKDQVRNYPRWASKEDGKWLVVYE